MNKIDDLIDLHIRQLSTALIGKIENKIGDGPYIINHRKKRTGFMLCSQ